MWRRFLQWVMDRRPTKVYIVGGAPLFYRAYLFTLFGRVWYLHHYLRSDPDDRGWHDHPMRARVVVLAGGYHEERLVGFDKHDCIIALRRRKPGRTFTIDEFTFHRVVIEGVLEYRKPLRKIEGKRWMLPTSWSLFISEYVEDKSWGFMRAYPAGFVEADVQGRNFRYEEAGPGLDEDPWWLTAPKGKEVCGG